MGRHSLRRPPAGAARLRTIRRARLAARTAGIAALAVVASGPLPADPSPASAPGPAGSVVAAGQTVPLRVTPREQTGAAPGAEDTSASWNQAIRAVPSRLRQPDLGVDAPVLPVEVRKDGELEVPDDPRLLGWWRQGAHPGGSGGVLIAGHVDSSDRGPGALFHLARTRPGQTLIVDTNLGPHRYTVTGVRRYDKAELPTSLFSSTGPGRLTLITCGGEFNTITRQYADNVVVTADPAETD